MFENLSNENIVMFALKHYDNPQCEGEKEFHDDMKRFKYIKRLLRKYKDHGVLKERLILKESINLFIFNLLFHCQKSILSGLVFKIITDIEYIRP